MQNHRWQDRSKEDIELTPFVMIISDDKTWIAGPNLKSLQNITSIINRVRVIVDQRSGVGWKRSQGKTWRYCGTSWDGVDLDVWEELSDE